MAALRPPVQSAVRAGGEEEEEGTAQGGATSSFCHSAILPFSHSAILPFCRSDAFLLRVQSVDSFLEELVVRSGLSDNYCNFCPNYDNLEGAWSWAQTSLQLHAGDKRDKIYS